MTKILIVDDSPDVLACVMQELARTGFDVRGADSSADACDFLDREKFDVLLSDIQMPELNGFELSRMLREENINTTRVAMSGGPFTEEEVKAAGFHAFIQKPFSASELITVLKNLADIN